MFIRSVFLRSVRIAQNLTFGTLQKPKKKQTEPAVTFRSNLASKKPKAQKKAHDRKKEGNESDSDDVEDESNPQVKLIDLLDQREATEDVNELDLSTASADNLDLDCDVNLRSSFLRNVLPKDMSGKCPVLEGGLDIPSTGEDTQSEFVGDEYVDWVQL